MNATISLLHATKGRPEKCIATMRLWAERATNPREIEYVLAVERDDAATLNHLDAILPTAEMPWFEGGVVVIRGAFGGSAPAWNSAYKASTGNLLVQVSDDFEPPQDWDTALLSRLPPMWENEKCVIAVSDGLRRDKLMTMFVCTRAYADQKGEFLHPGYQSMFSDDDATFLSYKDQSNGNCRVIEARDLLFRHDHHCIDGRPPDATYAWQSRPEAYAAGRKLFWERHPHAYGREARLWL